MSSTKCDGSLDESVATKDTVDLESLKKRYPKITDQVVIPLDDLNLKYPDNVFLVYDETFSEKGRRGNKKSPETRRLFDRFKLPYCRRGDNVCSNLLDAIVIVHELRKRRKGDGASIVVLTSSVLPNSETYSSKIPSTLEEPFELEIVGVSSSGRSVDLFCSDRVATVPNLKLSLRGLLLFKCGETERVRELLYVAQDSRLELSKAFVIALRGSVALTSSGNVAVEDATFLGETGFITSKGSRLKLTDCTLYGFPRPIVAAGATVLMERCRFSWCDSIGLFANESRVVVNACQFSGFKKGMRVLRRSSLSIARSKLSNGSIFGIDVKDMGSSVFVQNCRMKDVALGITASFNADVTVFDSEFDATELLRLDLNPSGKVTLKRNVCKNGKGHVVVKDKKSPTPDHDFPTLTTERADFPAETSFVSMKERNMIRQLVREGAESSPDAIAFQILCAYCGETGDNLKYCVNCKVVRYCSKECQDSHWPDHQLVCRALRKIDEEDDLKERCLKLMSTSA